MKAVVLAAGEGTRMRPLTYTRPKPMLPVAGTPLLERVMDAAYEHVDGYVVVVGYRSGDIHNYFGDSYRNKKIEYVEQGERAGTADAIEVAADVVDERFVVLNGDVVISSGLIGDLTRLDGCGIAVKPVENPSQYGIVDLQGGPGSRATGEVSGIVEKPEDPSSSLANLGTYVFEPEAFEYIRDTGMSSRGEREITDTISSMLDDDVKFEAVEYDGRWLDVGRPWELIEASNAVMEAEGFTRSVEGMVEDGATLKGDVVVEGGAEVLSGAYVTGPVRICTGAKVGPNCYVRGGTVVGEGVRVGNAVEVKNSILMEDAAVGHLSYVGDSVLGRNVNFGAGTVVANLRHDDENVRMDVKGERVDTGRRKLGVVLADDVKTGVNSCLNAGVKMGVGETALPGESVFEDRGNV
ncbi:MAG: bifunctional sugar-1-phosphate nucleotidylyltransferase/acetyltransferase [Halobacteria archaeon]